ncbi:Allantoinase [Streptomyces narbonensis]
MAYPGVFYSDDGRILRAMQRSADNGGLIMMHAENGIAIDVLVEQALARGETNPRYHGEVRKVLLEAEATHRAIQLARVAGAPLYVVHVSAEEAVAEIAAARDKGLPVFGETCPQYLFLSTDNLGQHDPAGGAARPARGVGGDGRPGVHRGAGCSQGRRPGPVGCVPVTAMTTEYRLVSAAMKRRLRLAPPQEMLATASGTLRRPIRVPSGS